MPFSMLIQPAEKMRNYASIWQLEQSVENMMPSSIWDVRYMIPDDSFSRWVGYGAIAAGHVYQLMENIGNEWWVFFHGTAAAISLWWPYSQDKGWTHKTWGHEAIGLLAMLPHYEPLQVFGTLMLADKMWNFDVHVSESKTLFNMNPAQHDRVGYGMDNLFADNMIEVKNLNGLMSNLPYIALASWISVEQPEMYRYMRPFVYALAGLGWLSVFASKI